MVKTVATIIGNIKKPWSKTSLITISAAVLATAFIAVFFYRNDINISFEALSSKDKYRAEAFVKKRQGINSRSQDGAPSDSNGPVRAGLSAKIDFDARSGKARLFISDKNGNPVSRLTVTGRLARVGETGKIREFKMAEFAKGDFRSNPLDLEEGGWVLMVSAYDPYTLNKDKLVSYTERPIYLGRK